MPVGPADPLSTRALLRRYLPPALFVLLVFGAFLQTRQPPAEEAPGREQTVFTGSTFGTTFSVKLVTAEPLGEDAERRVSSTIQGRLEEVDGLMSTWKQDSELSRLNRAPPGEPFAVSPATMEVLVLAASIHQQSGGVFDVTVGPLVNRWGFGPDGRPQAAPGPEEIAGLQARVGQEKLQLDAGARTATRTVEGLYVDLSAIAKGFGVDEVSEALLDLGYPDHMVEIGGEVRARGTNAHEKPWRIAIEKPDALTRTVYEVVPLRDEAMATSGDYRNFIELDGARVSHTIDPRTGRPVEHSLASVSVLADTCAEADGWATALNVLGPVEGPTLAEKLGLAAFFLVRTPAGFDEVATPAMSRRLDGTASREK